MTLIKCSFCNSTLDLPQCRIDRAKNLFCNRKCKANFQHANRKPNCQHATKYRRLKIDGVTYLEHRYVATQSIGRDLLPTEDVHHKDHNTLNNCPANLEVVPRNKHMSLFHRNHVDETTAFEMRKRGETLVAIASHFGVCVKVIRKLFLGTSLEGIRHQRRKVSDSQLLQLANTGISREQIAKHFGLQSGSVTKRLKRLGFVYRNCKYKHYFDENDVKNTYKQTRSITSTARQFGVAYGTMRKILQRFGCI